MIGSPIKSVLWCKYLIRLLLPSGVPLPPDISSLTHQPAPLIPSHQSCHVSTWCWNDAFRAVPLPALSLYLGFEYGFPFWTHVSVQLNWVSCSRDECFFLFTFFFCWHFQFGKYQIEFYGFFFLLFCCRDFGRVDSTLFPKSLKYFYVNHYIIFILFLWLILFLVILYFMI